MIDLATYLCGLGAGLIAGVWLTAIRFRRIASESLGAKCENAQLVRLLDGLQRAQYNYCVIADNRGLAEPETRAAWNILRQTGNAARGFLWQRRQLAS
ncbi:hypothetical protein OCAR_5545 [Afipia carboxidovorans OM5]|uniref:Uncharacterized protein n=1 Tax=Afipia carboxidovorans (strain ATCC 49405 / DSM 1227 / KCTC 32145 / OM5) TaxID=504832 RepID=B6JI09_AFIC5|nr:hypothetical protein [Afipia carboxidovorans]ACI92676.1 hypothetical protein OCAR_5545 [Afipia carboxidovorans OM5]AEI03569.1 hypothetical protein OCA4_c24490 [Afipia carboxidovorans OM4]AEI07146.1 hypothetical protein OCA5_c24500 [Afipia carboxidovorans OM5]